MPYDAVYDGASPPPLFFHATPHDEDEIVSFFQGVVIHQKRSVGIVELYYIYKYL